MSNRAGLKFVAGAIAMALSGGAFAAVTNAGANGTIFLDIYDSTAKSGYILDTGVPVSSFTSTSSFSPEDLSSDAALQSFIASESTGDAVYYSLTGVYTNGTTGTVDTLFTSNKATVAAASESKINLAATAIAGYLSGINNPSPGSTAYSLATLSATNQWGPTEAALVSDAGLGTSSDHALIGTALKIYSETATTANSTLPGSAVLSPLTGATFDLAQTGSAANDLTLSFSPAATAVPLPTPLLLLLSGLGLILVARRGQGASGAVLGGSLA